MAESSASRKRLVLAFWFIAVVYILSIDLKGVWTDEGFRFILLSGGQTWQQYNQSGAFASLSKVVTAVGTGSQYFPLFYLIDNAVIRIARSHSDVLLRLMNVLWLLLGLQGLLRLFRSYSESTRFFALAVFALNGYMMMHVTQIREYPMYLALLIWSSCLLFEILELPPGARWQHKWPLLAGYGVLMGLFFNSQPYCVFALAAQLLIVPIRSKNWLASFRRMALSYSVAAAIAAPWIILVLVRFHRNIDPGFWDKRPPTIGLLIEGLKEGFRALLIYGSWDGHPLMQAFAVVVVVGIPAAWILALRSSVPTDWRAVYALLTGAFFFVFQVAFFFLNQPLSIWPRYFIAYYFAYVVLATCAFSCLEGYARKQERRRWAVLCPAVLLFVSVAGLEQVRLYRNDPFMDTGMSAECNYRTLSQKLSRYVRPEDTVVYYHPLLAWTMGIYYPFNPDALSYDEINAGYFAKKSVLWVLDTGVVPDWTKRALDRLQSSQYTIAGTAELGCNCKLFRVESQYGAASANRSTAGENAAAYEESSPPLVTIPSLAREPYDLKGKHYTVSWLGKETPFSVYNFGKSAQATIELQLATCGTTHTATLLSGGWAVGRPFPISHVFWDNGAESVRFSVTLAHGENEFVLASEEAPTKLPPDRMVCFLLVGEITAVPTLPRKPGTN